MKPEPDLLRPDCWALTPRGAELARRLAAAWGGTVHVPTRLACEGECGFTRLAPAVAARWEQAAGHVFVAAAGIVVRCIAPLVRGKTQDPAVVVCDQGGQYAISLLSGHLGGANRLALQVAAYCGGQAVITTATDCEGLPAFDVLAAEADCAFADVAEVRAISAGLLAGQSVQITDPLGVLNRAVLAQCPLCQLVDTSQNVVPASETSDGWQGVLAGELRQRADHDATEPEGAPGSAGQHGGGLTGLEVVVSLFSIPPRPGRLRLHPRRLWVGVGCRRGVSGVDITTAIGTVLRVAEFAPQALVGIASADLKREEVGLHDAAQCCAVPLKFFAAEALAGVPVPHPSAAAARVLGVPRAGVCEAAALLGAGDGARLLVPKQIMGVTPPAARAERGAVGRITVAVAVSV